MLQCVGLMCGPGHHNSTIVPVYSISCEPGVIFPWRCKFKMCQHIISAGNSPGGYIVTFYPVLI